MKLTLVIRDPHYVRPNGEPYGAEVLRFEADTGGSDPLAKHALDIAGTLVASFPGMLSHREVTK